MQDSSTTAPQGSTTLPCWPQYKKFSARSGWPGVARQIAIGAAVALAFVLPMLPEAGHHKAAVSQPTRYMTLPRVVIAAKRERTDSPKRIHSLHTASTSDPHSPLAATVTRPD